MPLRQSRLNFSHRSPDLASNVSPAVPDALAASITKSLSSTDLDADTIVVNINGPNPQLPTPSESATELSSQGSASEVFQSATKNRVKDRRPTGELYIPRRSTSQARTKPLPRTHQSKFREELVDGLEAISEDNNRSVSGETLVSKTSQSSLLKSGIKALDLEWNVEDAVPGTLANENGKIALDDNSESESTLEVQMDDVENAATRAARTAAFKARKLQIAKKWEQRCKMAEKNATRRSGRASMVIDKAGDIISGIASGVLGKRQREAVNEKSATSGSVNQGLAAKRMRVNGEEKLPPSLPKRVAAKGDKKWLVSGLYAGQTRSFDARLTESGNNKKKHTPKIVQKAGKENAVLPLPMFAGERLLKQGRDFKLPFDVFSPVPPGQAKPEGWRKQNRNVVVGDAVDFWRSRRMQESSKCICTKETGCDQNCLNRTMYYECDNTNCNVSSSSCGNRQWNDLARRVKLSQAYTIGVDVIKTADRGHGVRANRTFEPGQIILEYTGEIITQEECERRMRTDYKNNECYYLMLFDQNMILDATKGSMARFVNHSCEPNCSMEKWTVNGAPRMALFAGERGIMTGEELTYDYNFDPYSQKNVQQCRCGAKQCRGFLGPKPKDVKPKNPDDEGSGKKPESRIAGAKRKVTEVLSESTNRLNKKRKIDGAKSSKPTTKKMSSPKQVVAVKKVTKKKVSIIKHATKSAKQRDSALKRIIASSKKTSKMAKGTRIVSSGSMKEALIPKGSNKKSPKAVVRSSSLKEKASNLKKNVVASVRGKGK